MSRSKSVWIVLATFVIGVFFAGGSALADLDSAQKQKAAAMAPVPIKTEIQIPISQKVDGYADGVVADLANYIGVIYQFGISIIGLVAAVMMIIGGFQYLTSAGDSGKIGAARKRITDALVGLVLALSAWALLNTINPALLRFAPISDTIAKNTVSTELLLLPWCEELTASGKAVTPVGSAKNCGNIGQYEENKSTVYCMFQGDCRIKMNPTGSFDPQVATCMQKGGLETKRVKDEITKDKNVSLGVCIPCMAITKTIAKELGYGLEQACFAWMTIVTKARMLDDPNQALWSYCGKAEKYDSCVQADMDCREVNVNIDKAHVGTMGCEKTFTCGCEGYDESPEPVWSDKDHSLAEFQKGPDSSWEFSSIEQLEDLPVHLGALCAINPCEKFKDLRVTEGELNTQISTGLIPGVSTTTLHQQSFIKGCNGAGVSSGVKGVRMITADCRNN